MATNLTGTTIASTYEKLIKRADTYVAAGVNIEVQNDSAVAAASSLYLDITNGNVGIGDTLPAEAKLSITGVASGDTGIKIVQAQNNYGLLIDSEATSESVIFVSDSQMETGTVMYIADNDALTTGKVANFHSASNDNSTRNLVEITNGHVSATGTTGLYIHQASSGFAIDVRSKFTSAADAGAKLRLYTDDTAAMASGHRLGVLEFAGAEDGGNTIITGARIEALATEAWSDGNNNADLLFYTTSGDASQQEKMRIDWAGNVYPADNSTGLGSSALPWGTIYVNRLEQKVGTLSPSFWYEFCGITQLTDSVDTDILDITLANDNRGGVVTLEYFMDDYASGMCHGISHIYFHRMQNQNSLSGVNTTNYGSHASTPTFAVGALTGSSSEIQTCEITCNFNITSLGDNLFWKASVRGGHTNTAVDLASTPSFIVATAS